jgi:hypothetical protein
MYILDNVLTPTLWQTVVPFMQIAAAYVPVCVVVCFAFSKERRAQ